jgi:hypothetical protein
MNAAMRKAAKGHDKAVLPISLDDEEHYCNTDADSNNPDNDLADDCSRLPASRTIVIIANFD